MRRILFVSGSRADYGPARRTLLKLHADPEIELQVLVTGMHLDPMHGETWREIEADGLCIADRVQGRLGSDDLAAMAGSIGLFLYGMSQSIRRLKPDIVLVLGDRGEQLAAAMAAAFQNVVVAHLCGGSLSGSIDDSIRHAITKFAHIHLPAHQEHAARIAQMGEDPARIFTVGLPGGNLTEDVKYSKDEICQKYSLPASEPYLLVVQHSVTQARGDAEPQIGETLEAVRLLPHHVLLANPNDDAGGRAILGEMKRYSAMYPRLHILEPPGSRELYASVMAHAAVQVGNSSSGIVEAMSVSLPVVNIGDRQRGREHLACLINVPYEQTKIREAIERALTDEHRRKVAAFATEFIIRDTALRVIDILKSVALDLASQPKTFFDVKGRATA